MHSAPKSRHLQPSSSREMYVIAVTGMGLSSLSNIVTDSRYDGVYLDDNGSHGIPQRKCMRMLPTCLGTK